MYFLFNPSHLCFCEFIFWKNQANIYVIWLFCKMNSQIQSIRPYHCSTSVAYKQQQGGISWLKIVFFEIQSNPVDCIVNFPGLFMRLSELCVYAKVRSRAEAQQSSRIKVCTSCFKASAMRLSYSCLKSK